MHPSPPVRAWLPSGLVVLASLVGCGGDSSRDPAPVPPAALGEPPPQGTHAAVDPEAGPGRRRAVNGLAGFQSRSTITFARQEGDRYRLETTYVFPGRARWRMEPEEAGDDRGARHMRFCWGSELWLLPEGDDTSIAFLGAEKLRASLQIELRRVAMTWPAELEWKPDGERRRAELPGLGSLVVELDPTTERPRAMESRLQGDEAYERLEGIEWRTIEERWWPGSWTLSSGGEVVWHETFEEILPDGRFLDAFFQPPDRRAPGEGSLASQPQRVQLPPRAVHPIPLPEGTSWEQAFSRAERELAVWKEPLDARGLRLEDRPAFLLSEQGLPIALELRLEEPPPTLPDGWAWLEQSDALAVMQDSLAGIRAGVLPTLRALVPEGSSPGTPYARVRREEGEVRQVQVVLPLVGGR